MTREGGWTRLPLSARSDKHLVWSDTVALSMMLNCRPTHNRQFILSNVYGPGSPHTLVFTVYKLTYMHMTIDYACNSNISSKTVLTIYFNLFMIQNQVKGKVRLLSIYSIFDFLFLFGREGSDLARLPWGAGRCVHLHIRLFCWKRNGNLEEHPVIHWYGGEIGTALLLLLDLHLNPAPNWWLNWLKFYCISPLLKLNRIVLPDMMWTPAEFPHYNSDPV